MTPEYKCHNCNTCLGLGCIGQMPGMGGPKESINFIKNCEDWENIKTGPFPVPEEISYNEILRLAPVTGALENIGYPDEKQYYFDMTKKCHKSGIKISLGDGTPDHKLLWGIEAVQHLQESSPETKAAVFIKPYPQEKYLERLEWAVPVAEIIGIDIDSYNILTMRNLVNLEKKSPEQLIQIKNLLAEKNIPFAIKGVFTEEDVELVKKVQPDIIYISNHGGRVETDIGSTARFLEKHGTELKKYCRELWVDGGIRTEKDIRKALSWGVSSILLGRPFITALCYDINFSKIIK